MYDNRAINFQRLNPDFRNEELAHEMMDMRKKVALGGLLLGALAIFTRNRRSSAGIL